MEEKEVSETREGVEWSGSAGIDLGLSAREFRGGMRVWRYRMRWDGMWYQMSMHT